MKKTFFTLVVMAFIGTTTALAYPITIKTSCGIHNTDTVLWEGLTEWEIWFELEQICNQSPSTPIE